MSQKTILIVEDDPKLMRLLSTSLDLAGYQVISCETGGDALNQFHLKDPDLIILDLGLPDMDGLEVLREIRTTSISPVIIVTARDDEQDKVRGLELGADDYLTKPFGSAELEARIQAVLRRMEWSPQATDVSTYDWRDLAVDFRRRRVRIRGEEVHLTPTEYDLLRVLIQHSGEVMLHSDLLAVVWGEEYRNDLAILRVNVSRLRQKLEVDPRDPEYVLTVPGVGYSLPSPEDH
jgi:two-component system KDP operon response regulator KdpE